MKKITRFTLTALTALTLFASCKNAVIDNSTKPSVQEIQMAYLKIGNTKVAYRTLKPTASTSDLTNLVLTGSRSGDETQQNRELANAETLSELKSQTIQLQTGTWDFTLTADMGNYSFSGSKTGVKITADGENRITFTLTSTGNEGEFSVKIIFPHDENLTKVEGTLKKAGTDVDSFTTSKADFTEESADTYSITYQKVNDNKIASGDYSLSFAFYAEGTDAAINTLDYIVRVEAGFVTTAEKTVSLNETYTITLDNNITETTDTTVSIVGNVAVQTKYSRKSETIDLPQLTRDNFEFGGWYDNENCTGNKVTSIPTGSTGDKTFYAKWNKIIANPTIDVSFGVNVNKDIELTKSLDSVTGEWHFTATAGFKTYTLTVDGVTYEADEGDENINKFTINFSNFTDGIYDICVVATDWDESSPDKIEYYSDMMQFPWPQD